MMLPVRVDFPESTWPIKIKLADYKWKESIFAYLFGSQVLAFNSLAVMVGSSFLMITSSSFYFCSLGFCLVSWVFLLFYFFFFLSRLKS